MELPKIEPGTVIPALALDCVRDVILSDLFTGHGKYSFLNHLKTSLPESQTQLLAIRSRLLGFVKSLNDQSETIASMEAATSYFWPVLIRAKDLSDAAAVIDFVGNYYECLHVAYVNK